MVYQDCSLDSSLMFLPGDKNRSLLTANSTTMSFCNIHEGYVLQQGTQQSIYLILQPKCDTTCSLKSGHVIVDAPPRHISTGYSFLRHLSLIIYQVTKQYIQIKYLFLRKSNIMITNQCQRRLVTIFQPFQYLPTIGQREHYSSPSNVTHFLVA